MPQCLSCSISLDADGFPSMLTDALHFEAAAESRPPGKKKARQGLQRPRQLLKEDGLWTNVRSDAWAQKLISGKLNLNLFRFL